MLRSNLAHAATGFVLMGGWAALANAAHPMPAPVKAGLVQGALTACITLGLKQVIEAVSARMRGLWRLILPPLAAFTLSLALLVGFHSIAQTPEIWTTIFVPLTVSTGYGAIYAYGLMHHGS